MKKACLFLLFLTLSARFSFAQQTITFDKTFDGLFQDQLTDVVQTSDGGFAAIGSAREFSLSPGYANIYIRRYDQYGDTLWTKAIGGAHWMTPGSIQQTNDGGFIICGQDAYAASQAYIARLNATGTIIWERWLGNGTGNGIGGDWFSTAKQNADGTFTAVGSTRRSNATDSTTYVYLVKVGTTGNTIWEKTFRQAYGGQYLGQELSITSDGGYFITANKIGNKFESWLIKTNSQGILQWTKSYSQLEAFSGNQTADGGYIIGGNTNDATWNRQRSFLFKLNAVGDTTWTKKYPGHGVSSVIQTSDGGYAFTGAIIGDSVTYPNWQFPFYFMNLLAGKTDQNGKLRFMRTYGDSIDDAGYSIKETADGGFVVAGVKDYVFSVGVGPLQPGPDKGLLLKFFFMPQNAVNSIKDEVNNALAFQLFPNPAARYVTIQLPENVVNSDRLQFRITNMLGSEVLFGKVTSSEMTIERGDLKPGVYIVQLIDAETGKTTATKKLILR